MPSCIFISLSQSLSLFTLDFLCQNPLSSAVAVLTVSLSFYCCTATVIPLPSPVSSRRGVTQNPFPEQLFHFLPPSTEPTVFFYV